MRMSEFSCKICFESFNKGSKAPISLICGHSFCQNCIGQLGERTTTICCAFCRKKTYTKKLGKNITLLEVLEHHNLLGPEDETAIAADPNGDDDTNEWQLADRFINQNQISSFQQQLQSTLTHAAGYADLIDRTTAISEGLFALENQLHSCADYFAEVQQQLASLNEEVDRRSWQNAYHAVSWQRRADGHWGFGNWGGGHWGSGNWGGGNWGSGPRPPIILNPLRTSTSSNEASTSSGFANGAFGGRRRRRLPVVALADLPIEPPASEPDQSTWANQPSGWN